MSPALRFDVVRDGVPRQAPSLNLKHAFSTYLYSNLHCGKSAECLGLVFYVLDAWSALIISACVSNLQHT